MEFWASEVKSGETFKVTPGEDVILHLSQANLGEVKKATTNESVYLFVNVDGKKLVLGTLSSEKLPQIQFDLVFDRDFELSHSWKGGSVYFFGYRTSNNDGEDMDDESDSSSEDEDMPLSLENTGKPETKVKEEKSADAQKVEKDSSTNKKASVETANGLPKSEDDDSSDDDSISDDESTDMDEAENSEDDEDDSEDDSEDEEDESEEDEPAKAEPGKKRASDSEPETPATKKKAKLTTPEKTDGKKGSGVHVDTPHPSKQGGKSSATQYQKAAKSSGGGSHVCKSCSRTFGTENALDSHTKAKHGADK